VNDGALSARLICTERRFRTCSRLLTFIWRIPSRAVLRPLETRFAIPSLRAIAQAGRHGLSGR